MFFSALLLMALSVLQRVNSLASRPRENDSSKPDIAACYVWHNKHDLQLSEFCWHKCNTLIYSFATVTPSIHEVSLGASGSWLLSQFVNEVHTHGAAAHVALGGRDGSIWYSSNVATAQNRTHFVETVTKFAQKYKLDGINFDWQYPNHRGLECNIVNPHDTENFLLFLQELRDHPVGRNLTLSATAPIKPWRDASGSPSKDISGFAKVLDYISIMNHDVWGPWSTVVGPNSPLNDMCAAPTNKQGSAVSAVKAWTVAGIPAHQLVLVVPTYGHSFSVSPSDAFVKGTKILVEYPTFNASNQPLGDAWDSVGSNDVCGVFRPAGGTFELWALVVDDFLDHQGRRKNDKGIYYRFDNCSKTVE